VAEGTGRWIVGVTVAVASIAVSAVVTLIAAGRISCPTWVCQPAQSPTPVSSIVDTGGPHVAISPGSGPAGTQIAVHLTGFGANAAVAITLGETRLGTAQTDPSGSADISITVPASFAAQAPEKLTVTAFEASGEREDTATFQLTAS
jgi:hypothetical protein